MASDENSWLVRAGRYGERDSWALDEGFTPGGFGEVSDLSRCSDLSEIHQLVVSAYPDAQPQAAKNFAAQLWTLRGRMSEGDWVVLPLKSSSQLAIGKLTGPYMYLADEPDFNKRHVRSVQWIRTDVPRSAVKQDLLYSLGAFSTYCQIKRNQATARIAAIAATGIDPGTSTTSTGSVELPGLASDFDATEAEADSSLFDLEQHAKDRVSAVILQEFSGHRMQELVAALLQAQGFTCHISPAGTDGGIDILAGSGPLGLNEPQLVVQVKSEQSPIGDQVVHQLLGAASRQNSAQGLLVAWGGVTRPAHKTLLDNYFRLRVWGAEDLIQQITSVYPQLPEEIRASLPLKQIWIAVEEGS